MTFEKPDFSARRQKINQQVNADLLEYVDTAILSEAAVALEAAQDTIKNGQAAHEDLIKIAEATSVAHRVLLAATKMVTVAAVESGSPEEELSTAAGVTKKTVQRWVATDIEVPLPLGEVWWEPVSSAPSQDTENGEASEEEPTQPPAANTSDDVAAPLSEDPDPSPGV